MQTVRTNLTVNASTQYTNLTSQHHSMCMFNGVVLGAGPGGLFKTCCGDSDNGVPIDAYFTPHTNNFGTSYVKRPRRVYLGGDLDGDLQVTILGEGKRVNGPFSISPDVDEETQQRMFKVDRAKGWVYGKFTFNNVDGSYFAIDAVQVLNNIHARRRY